MSPLVFTILLMTGASDEPYHHWRESSAMLRALLEATGRFAVRVVDDPRKVNAAALTGCHAVLIDYNGPRFPATVERMVEDFVRNGGGLIAYHQASYGAFFGMEFRDKRWRAGSAGGAWAAFPDMVGMTWEPEKIGHARRGEFKVEWRDGSEPSFDADDELYHRLTLKPGVRVLARALSPRETGGTGEREPLIWVNRYGRGRVFFTTLGHDARAWAKPGLRAAFARGVEWAAAREMIVGASAFFDQIPKGDLLTDARALRVPATWQNTALVLKSKEDAIARADIPEAGNYSLHVRRHGPAEASFQVLINGKSGDVFELAKGPAEIRLTAINPAPVFDMLVLSRSAEHFDEPVSQWPDDVRLLKEYKIPPAHAVKFGDLTGDGKMDFVVLTRSYSALAFDHDDRELWRYEAPEAGTRERGEFEAPGSVWDFDGDGRAEFVHWRMIDGKEWIAMADGRTGRVVRQVEWPTTALPHVYNNFRTAIARLHQGRADSLVVFTDSGGTISITAFDRELRRLWQHVERLKKDHLGHYPYPVDINDDGVDEVFVSHIGLDASGRVLWSNLNIFNDNHDHLDSLRFADINGDGALDIAGPQSDVGIALYQARTGEMLWKRPADHAQQVAVGRFLSVFPRPQVAVNGRVYGNRKLGEPYLSAWVYWYDPKGKLLAKWPRNPLNGNPDFVKGDWSGTGKEELFWYKFRMNSDGKGTLYFAEPVYHMFDFMGTGADQVIALNNAAGLMQVYGSASAKPKPAKRDSEYLRNAVANHTHY